MARALWRRPIIWWGARAGTAFGSTSVSKPVGERRLTCVVEHVLRTVRKVPPVTGPPGSGQRWRRRRRLPRHESPSAMTCDGCRACRRRCVWAGWAPPPRCAPHPVGDAVFVAPAAASVAREGWTATAAVVGVAAEGPRRRWWAAAPTVDAAVTVPVPPAPLPPRRPPPIPPRTRSWARTPSPAPARSGGAYLVWALVTPAVAVRLSHSRSPRQPRP